MAAFVAATLFIATAAGAQVPRGVSPRFARVIGRSDTTVVAWIVARRGTDLDQVAARITALGGRVRFTSRFAHAVSAEVTATRLRDLARESGVMRVQPVGTYYRRPLNPEAQGLTALPPYRLTASVPGDTLYGPVRWPYIQLNVIPLHSRGLRGAGVRIALLDTGFNTTHPHMVGANIIAQRDFVFNDNDVRDQPGETQGEMSHGTGVWSLIAARTPGTLFGMAPDAEFLLAKTEFTLTETRVEEDRWVAAVEWAIGLGAQIISSSLGYLSFDGGFTYSPGQINGDVAVTTVAADSAAARGVLVIVAGGNAGPNARTIDTPADADSAVAVGATDSLGHVAGFSSRGPTADGRIKPDVVAPGALVAVAGTLTGTTLTNGTSFSAPLIAGLAALVQGLRPGLPAADLRSGLLAASSRFLAPDNSMGYGVPNGLAFYAFPVGIRAVLPATDTLQTITPTFSWNAGTPPADAGPNQYFLRVATDSLLQHRVVDTAVAKTSFTMPRALPPGTRLFWRIVASSGLGVAESTAVTGPAVIPPWVRLVTLALPQGATIRDSLPLFAWRGTQTALPGGITYDVDIYPASRTPAQAVASARGLTDTVFQVTAPLERNVPFRWRVVAHVGPDSEVVTSPGTFLVADASVPSATVLFQNFPNPFPNASVGIATTCIWFDIAQQGEVRLEIFDIRGRMVRRLSPSPVVPLVLAAGRYGRPSGDAPGTCDAHFSWDGRDDAGAYARPGVYVYRLTAPGFQGTKRIVYLGPS